MARMSGEEIREKLESCVEDILGSENKYEIHSCSLYIEGISAGCAILYKQEDGTFQGVKVGEKELYFSKENTAPNPCFANVESKERLL